MAVLSTLRLKPQKKKISLLNTLRRYFLGSTKCKEENKNPEFSSIEQDDVSVNVTEKVPGKKTLPPLNQAYTEKARSLLDQTLSWESLKKSQCPRNLFAHSSQIDDNRFVEPKIIKVAESPIENQIPYEHRSNQVELKDDLPLKTESKKIFLIPIPAKVIKVAEAPIENRVAFQSIWKPSSTNTEQQKSIFPEPTVSPASVSKRVRFQLTPSVKIIPSLHPKEASFPPSSFTVVRQIVGSADRAAFLAKQEAKTFRKDNKKFRPHA